MPLHLLFAFILTLFLCLPATAMENLVISIGDSPADVSKDDSAVFNGLLLELGKRTNLDITVVHLPSRRALEMAENGQSAGIAFWHVGLEKEFPHLVRLGEPLLISRVVAFTRKGSRIDSWDDLAGKLATLPRGWALPENSLPASTRLTEVRATHHGMAMLDAGRVDVSLTILEMGLHEIVKHGLNRIDRNPPTLYERELYLYLHERHAQLLPVLEKALKKAKADGTWYRLYKQAVAEFDECKE